MSTFTCGENVTCSSREFCFLSSSGPSCHQKASWRLDNYSFPPIKYMSNKLGVGEGSPCELLDCSSWNDSNKKWLINYFYRNWINSSSNSNSETIVPRGSFVNPLEYLGNCKSSSSSTPNLFCSNGRCVKRFDSTNVCRSSNQCLSANCGDIPITNITNLESESNPNQELHCVDGNSIWKLLDSSGKTFYMEDIGSSSSINNGSGGGSNSSSAGSTLAVITIIFFILFVLSTLCCYAKKVMRKQREEYMQRSGEGGLRRGGSLLNRSNSVRTLPPYTAVSDPPNQTGIVTTLTNFLFPGELPPPYEDENDSSEDQDIRRVTNLNFISDIQNMNESRSITASERDDEGDREDHTTIEVRDGGEEETPVVLSMNTPDDNNVNDSTNGNPGDDTINDDTNDGKIGDEENYDEKNNDTFEFKSIEEQNTDEEGEEEIGNSHERRESEVGLIGYE